MTISQVISWFIINSLFDNNIISNFMDRIETNLLELLEHPETSECFSVISVIIFEVNIVAKQKQAY